MHPTGIEYPVGSGTYIDIDASSSDYQAIFLAESTYAVTSTPDMEPRRDSSPLLRAISVDGRTIPMMVKHNPAGSVAQAQFHNNVKRWFDPGKGRSGVRYLRVVGDDGNTELRLPVHVVSLTPRPNAIGIYDVILQAATPYFEALTEGSKAITASGTAVNVGNARAQVTLELAGGTSINGKRFTVADNSGYGLVSYPIVINYGATSTQSEAFVLVNGASVPFAQGSTSAYYWLFMDVPAGGSVTVDIIVGTGITNPLAGTLNMGNLDTSNTSNASLKWDSWSVKDAPVRTAQWKPADLRIFWTANSLEYYELTTDSPTQTVINIASTSSGAGLRMDGNALYLSTGLAGQASSTLTGLSRQINVGSPNYRSYVYYRTRDSEYWQVGWSYATTANPGPTVTTAIDMPGAVEIAVGMELPNTSATAGIYTLTLSWNTAGEFVIDSGEVPTVSSATATTWRLLDGTITNTDNGQTVTFSNHLRRNGTLTIAATSDYNQRGVTNSVAGPMLGEVLFSDPVDLFSLDPGENAIEETIDGGVTVKHRDTYL